MEAIFTCIMIGIFAIGFAIQFIRQAEKEYNDKYNNGGM